MTNIYVSQVAVTRACDHRVTTILLAVLEQAKVGADETVRRGTAKSIPSKRIVIIVVAVNNVVSIIVRCS